MKRKEFNCATGEQTEVDQVFYWVAGNLVLQDASAPEPEGAVLATLAQIAALTAPVPPTKAQQIAALLAEKRLTREDVWNCILASNALSQAQATATGQTVAAVTAYNRSRNKFFRECELLEAAIRVIELAP